MTSDSDYTTYSLPTYSNGLLFVGYDGKTYYSTGTWLETEKSAIERLQKNNEALEEITDNINTLSISNIYTVSTEEEPDASLGNDGDLYLVVSE